MGLKNDYDYLLILHCHSIFPTLAELPKPQSNPCIPSPCGPYSECRRVDNHAVCFCQKDYMGTPPACRPECMVSSECALNKACVNKKCVDPCPGTCGPDARCQVVNHNPICSCSPGYTGDPFVRCIKERKQLMCFFAILFTYFLSFFSSSVFLYKVLIILYVGVGSSLCKYCTL